MLSNILDFCDGYYPILSKKKAFLCKEFLCHFILSLRYHLNNYLCWYYHTFIKKKVYRPEDCEFIVSLTSYPARIDLLWKVLEIIFNQKSCKERYSVILNLITTEFEGKELPDTIKHLQARGLTIRFHPENLRCHNKYLYTFRDYPNKTVITVDDDLQYNHHSISALIQGSRQHPQCIIYNRGYKILKGKTYNDWPLIVQSTPPRSDACPTGVGGVLYPPNCCHSLVTNIEAIKLTCLRADDLWLNFMSRLNKTKTVCTGLRSTFIQLPDSNQSTGLFITNTSNIQNGNDIQIENITCWAKKEFECDYFVNADII